MKLDFSGLEDIGPALSAAWAGAYGETLELPAGHYYCSPQVFRWLQPWRES